MNKARKVGSLVAAVVATTALIGGTAGAQSPSTGATQGGKVALLLPEKHTARYEAADRPFFEAHFAEVCPGVELIYNNASEDAAAQQQQAEAAITSGATVLVLGSVDSQAAGQIVNDAQAQGVKVISYDRLIRGESAPDYLVTFNNRFVGTLQGQALLARLTADGVTAPRLIWINGSSKTAESALFADGAHEVLDPVAVIVKEDEMPNWKPEEAQQIVEAVISSVGADGFDGVLVANDGGAGGVYAAFAANGIDPATKPITGQDAELAGVQRILAGQQFMTVYKALQTLAETSADIACSLAKGEAIDPALTGGTVVNNGSFDIPAVLIEPIAVTADGATEGTRSVKDTVVADLFYGPDTVAQICTADLAAACEAAGIGS